jgi:hypothetical protein
VVGHLEELADIHAVDNIYAENLMPLLLVELMKVLPHEPLVAGDQDVH